MLSSLLGSLLDVVAPTPTLTSRLIQMLEAKQENLALKLLADHPDGESYDFNLAMNEGGNGPLMIASAYG